MEDELQGAEVLDLILQELEAGGLAAPDGQHELIQSVSDAIADHPEDINAQAAAALATVVAYGAVADLEDFELVLRALREVEGLQSIEDVHYVGLGPRGDVVLSLRRHIPQRDDRRLTEADRQAISAFIEGTFDSERRPPTGGFDGGPRP